MKKKCNKCQVEKDLSEFRKDNHRSDGYRSDCKVCARAYAKSAYMERYSAAVQVRDKERRASNRQLMEQHKTQCVRCSEPDKACLEFHHRDPADKLFTIAHNVQRSTSVLLEEIAKCVVICSNCHKKLHAGRFTL